MNKLIIIISAVAIIQLGGCYYDKVEPVVMCDQPDTVSFGLDIMKEVRPREVSASNRLSPTSFSLNPGVVTSIQLRLNSACFTCR